MSALLLVCFFGLEAVQTRLAAQQSGILGGVFQRNGTAELFDTAGLRSRTEPRRIFATDSIAMVAEVKALARTVPLSTNDLTEDPFVLLSSGSSERTKKGLAIFGICCATIAVIAIAVIVCVQFNPAVLKSLVKTKKKRFTGQAVGQHDGKDIVNSRETHTGQYSQLEYRTQNTWKIMPDTRTEGDLTHNTDDASVVLQIRNKNWLRILDAYAVVVELQPNTHLLVSERDVRRLSARGINLLSVGDALWYTVQEENSEDKSAKDFQPEETEPKDVY